VALVTFTETEQTLVAWMIAPDSISEFPPLTAVTVPPVQFVEGEALAVFTMPDGYISVKAAPVIAVVLPLFREMVMIEAPFINMEAGLKFLPTVGAFSAAWMGTAPSDHAADFVLVHIMVVVPAAPAFVLPLPSAQEVLFPCGAGFHRIV
jgi:hypothetical protein